MNNMCSKKCAVPYKGFGSRAQPTFTSKLAADLSASWSEIRRHLKPF